MGNAGEINPIITVGINKNRREPTEKPTKKHKKEQKKSPPGVVNFLTLW